MCNVCVDVYKEVREAEVPRFPTESEDFMENLSNFAGMFQEKIHDKFTLKIFFNEIKNVSLW